MTADVYRRPKTEQYRCMACGFQSGSLIFKPVAGEDGKKRVRCPDCGSEDIIDADSMARVNPA